MILCASATGFVLLRNPGSVMTATGYQLPNTFSPANLISGRRGAVFLVGNYQQIFLCLAGNENYHFYSISPESSLAYGTLICM